MPVFEIQKGGKTFEVDAPNQNAAIKALGSMDAPAAPQAPQNQPTRTWGDTATDVAAGFVKSAGRTVKGVVDDLPHAFGGAGLSDYIDMATGRPKGDSYNRVNTGLQSTNTPQRVGGALETAAELAIPVWIGATAAADALPSTARAGKAFQDVMAVAGPQKVRVSETANAAMRIQQLADRGGSMPKVVENFLNRVTDPSKGRFTYEEARDFASNIGKLSADEYGKLTPVVRREVATMAAELNKAIGNAAAKAGKWPEYKAAMQEYSNAIKLRGALSSAARGAKQALPYAVGGGAAGLGYEAVKKLTDLIP